MKQRAIYAVVPAAGLSRRMGQPKLLLPLGGKTVIARLLDALNRPEVRTRAVVLKRSDEPLLEEVNNAGAWAILPELDPAEMRQSVEIALSAIRKRFSPNPDDGWMLVPADHPVLSPGVIEQMIRSWQTTSAEILVPVHNNRRGHPTIFAWELADKVAEIPADQGLNWFLRQGNLTIEELPIADPAIFTDLDTPEDYEALKKAFPGES